MERTPQPEEIDMDTQAVNKLGGAIEAALAAGWSPRRFREEAAELWIEILKEKAEEVKRDLSDA
jgi:hypothetical protein